MIFNMSEIRESVGDSSLLTRAELRMLIKNPRILEEERVELYYSSGTTFRYHTSQFITNALKNKWLSFDVTEPLRTWLRQTGDMTRAVHHEFDYSQDEITNQTLNLHVDHFVFQRTNRSSNCVRSVTVKSPTPLSVSLFLGWRQAGWTQDNY